MSPSSAASGVRWAAAYRRLLDGYPGWQLMFVVPTAARARWLRDGAGEADYGVADRASVTSLAAHRGHQLAVGLVGLGESARHSTIDDLLVPAAPRRSRTPTGSNAWLRLLGEGAVEELDDVVW